MLAYSSSSSSGSHLSKHYLSSKDWISSYVDSHVEIDPKSVFDRKSKSVSPLELELMMIAPSLPTKSGTTDWMAEFYENIRGYPSNSIKPDLQTSSSCSPSFKNQTSPLEPMLLSSCSIDVYVDNTTSCCNQKDTKSDDDTPQDFTRPSIDATLNLLKDLKKDFTTTNPDVIRSFLMSTDNAFETEPKSIPVKNHHEFKAPEKFIAERCCSLGEKTWIPSCSTSPPTIPTLDDFMKVLSSCSNSSAKAPQCSMQTPTPTLPSKQSKMMPVNMTNKKRRNIKRCCSNSSSRMNPLKLYVSEIRPTDVLLGRGGRSNHHPGNVAYRKQVGDLREWYRTSKEKRIKTDLSQLLVDWVQKENSGRFLQLETTTTLDGTSTTPDNETGDKWYVVNNLVARRKAAQALREHMTLEERKARKEQQRKQGLSKTM
jgi:hypothetical protein